MDFPDLGAAVDKPKRDKMPRQRNRAAGGGEKKPKSALASMINGKSKSNDSADAGASDRLRPHAGSVEAVQAEVLSDIGPPPRSMAEPDEAAHKEAAAEIQTRIDAGEKRMVCFVFGVSVMRAFACLVRVGTTLPLHSQ